jgi:hypothetical protein
LKIANINKPESKFQIFQMSKYAWKLEGRRWMKCTTGDGTVYYHNEETNETEWEPPEGYISGDEEDAKVRSK